MKAIILEVKGGYAAALREDGFVVKTRQLAEVGETIELNEKVVSFPSQGKRIARTAVAAALALAVTGGAYTYTNVAAASYVTLDTEETSVELAVNRVGKVVAVRALDEDSTELAQTLSADVRRMSVEDAVNTAMERLDGSSTVVAGVTGETEKRTADLHEAVQRAAGRAEREGVELVTLEISRDERRAAGEQSVSAGRVAFERGGGRWRDDAENRTEVDDWSGVDISLPDDAPARPAFKSNGGTPANNDRPAPPADGGTPGGPPPRAEGVDGGEDNRPTPRDMVEPQAKPGQNTQPKEPDENQTGSDEYIQQIQESNGITTPNDMPNDGQTPPNAPDGQPQPPESGSTFGLAPQGGMQPPQGNMQPPQGGMPGGPGERR